MDRLNPPLILLTNLFLNPVLSLDNRLLFIGLIWCSNVSIWVSCLLNLAIGTSTIDGVNREEIGASLVNGVDSTGVVSIGSEAA